MILLKSRPQGVAMTKQDLAKHIKDSNNFYCGIFYDHAVYFNDAWKHSLPLNKTEDTTFSNWLHPQLDSDLLQGETAESIELTQRKMEADFIKIGYFLIKNKSDFRHPYITKEPTLNDKDFHGSHEEIAYSIFLFSESAQLTTAAGFQINDYNSLKHIAFLYFCLNVLYRDYGKTIDIISGVLPKGNPVFALDLFREEIAEYGNQLIGFWYANSQEVRGFVDKWKKQISSASKGGKTRATSSSAIKLWQEKAGCLKKKNPTLSKRSMARLISEKTGESFETIRKNI